MRATDFITERASSILYHYTALSAAVQILTTGKFELSSATGISSEEEHGIPGYPYYLSTTRTLLGGYHSKIGDSAVIFNLNGDFYNNNYKAKPVNYWGDELSDKPAEAEDRIFSKSPSISAKGITAVHIYVKEMGSKERQQWGANFPGWARKILILAKKRGIPAYLYANQDNWRLQKLSAALPISKDLEILQGPSAPANNTRRSSSWMNYWIELIHKNSTASLSQDANKTAYTLAYNDDYQLRDLIAGLKNDMANARFPHSANRPVATQIIKYMQQNHIGSIPDLISVLIEKWKEILTKENK